MHGSRVLLALQEQTKWRERKRRLEERLAEVRARKRFLQKELEVARLKAAQLGASLVRLKGTFVERAESRTSGLGTLR